MFFPAVAGHGSGLSRSAGYRAYNSFSLYIKKEEINVPDVMTSRAVAFVINGKQRYGGTETLLWGKRKPAKTSISFFCALRMRFAFETMLGFCLKPPAQWARPRQVVNVIRRTFLRTRQEEHDSGTRRAAPNRTKKHPNRFWVALKTKPWDSRVRCHVPDINLRKLKRSAEEYACKHVRGTSWKTQPDFCGYVSPVVFRTEERLLHCFPAEKIASTESENRVFNRPYLYSYLCWRMCGCVQVQLYSFVCVLVVVLVVHQDILCLKARVVDTFPTNVVLIRLCSCLVFNFCAKCFPSFSVVMIGRNHVNTSLSCDHIIKYNALPGPWQSQAS